MEFSSLLKKLKRSHAEGPEQFLAIQIDTEFVKTAVWEVRNQLTEIVALGSTAEWDGTSTELLVEAIDNSLAIALERLQDKKDPSNVIFGLPETWASTESVVAPRLADLKRICEKLELKPLGFVVTTEAITHYLRAKEGTPFTGILLRVSISEVAVSVVTIGKIEGTHVAGRSGDLAADVKEGLTRFGERESMPSRIVLYNGGEDLQDLIQQLQAYDWQAVFPFLHLPKIESMNDMFSITAIAVAGGAEVAKSLGFTITEPKPEPLEEKQTENSIPALVEHEIEISAEETEKIEEPLHQSIDEPEEMNTGSPIEAPVRPSVIPKFPSFDFGKLFSRIHLPDVQKWRFHTPSLPIPQGIGLTLVFILVLIALVGVGIVFAARRFPRVTVRIRFEGQNLSERLSLSVDPSITSIDPSTNNIPAEKVTVTKSGEQSKNTVGKKTTGDKATGELKIYNKTNATKKFPSGTVISTSGKDFTLIDDMTVASQSAQSTGAGVNITYGSSPANVTASNFGSEFNLDANTEFTVAGLSPSAFSAKNDTAFSGGTKREIQIVSKKDKNDLRDELLMSLKNESATEIESKTGGKKVFTETMTANPTEEKYSAQAGDEASSVTLSMTADINALAMNETDYQNVVAAVLQSKIPDGFALLSSALQTSIENVQVSDKTDKITFDAVVTAPLMPKVSETDIVSKIIGKRPSAATETLKSLPHLQSIEMTFSPVLPSILQWVPSSKSHVLVDIGSQ